MSNAPPQTAYYLDGYSDRLSYRPGEEIGLHISTNSPSYSLEIKHLGSSNITVAVFANVKGHVLPTPEDAASAGCRWPLALPKIVVPSSWKTGVYVALAHLVDNSRGDPIFFVIRPERPGRDANILLQLTTNTHNAYNGWGGYSFYPPPIAAQQAPRISFDRPGAWTRFHDWELPFIRWAEQAGYQMDYAVNTDLEFHPDLLACYRLVLSVGHDEYWSAAMRDHLERFIAAGGNAAFFSGNSICWQVRSEDNGRTLVCWKERFAEDPFYHAGQPDHPDHRFLTALWSHPSIKRPENMILGSGTRAGGYSIPGKCVLTVNRAEHWVFQGTRLQSGDTFGRNADREEHRIVGYECDGCEFKEEGGILVPTHLDGSPRSFQILAHAPAAWGNPWDDYPGPDKPLPSGSCILGVHTTNGTVFSAGTIGWVNGLRDGDAVVERITRNVLDRLSSAAGH